MAKHETTATEIAPANLADEAAAAAFQLDPHLINLMWSGLGSTGVIYMRMEQGPIQEYLWKIKISSIKTWITI